MTHSNLSLHKLTAKFLATQIDGELILVHADSGEFFSIKDTGLAIWQALDDHPELGVVSERLQSQFDVDQEKCRASVEDFAAQLVEAGFAEYG